MALLDEFHAHPSAGMREVMRTAMAARRQPLLLMITTAGADLSSACYEEHNYAEAVLRGEVKAPTFFPLLYNLDDKENGWQDPKNWVMANPNLEVSVSARDIKSEIDELAGKPQKMNSFLQKRMCVWVSGVETWINQERWKACAMMSFDFEKIVKKPKPPCLCGD